MQELNLPMFKDAMINELKETMHLASSVGWHIAKAAFGEVMSKIELGRISWDDPDGLWKARMDGKSDAYMGQHRGNRMAVEPYNYQVQYTRHSREGYGGQGQQYFDKQDASRLGTRGT